MWVPEYPEGETRRGGRAHEELARGLARGPHTDPLRTLDAPVAEAVDRDDVALARGNGELFLVDAPAAVGEDELEAVEDGVAPGGRGNRLAEQDRVLLDQLERLSAPGALLVLLDPAELEPPSSKCPFQCVCVALDVIGAHSFCHRTPEPRS